MDPTQNGPALGGAGPGCADRFAAAADRHPDTTPSTDPRRTVHLPLTAVDLFRAVWTDERRGFLTRQTKAQRLQHIHAIVAREQAERAYMALSTQPDFLDRTVSDAELGARLEAAFASLKAEAAEVRERYGWNDDVTRLCAEGWLVIAFYERFNAIALQACLSPHGGRA